MNRASRVRVAGPLARYALGFREELAGQGYTPSSAATHLALMAQLSRWLDQTGLDVGGLTLERLEQFLCANRAQGHRFPRSGRGLVPLLDFLRSRDAAPAPGPVALSTSEELLERFGLYLLSERGLSAGTVVGYQHAARVFLAGLEHGDGPHLERLSAGDVNRFMVTECTRRSVASAKNLVSGLRSLLRFLYLQRLTASPLSGAVPAVAGWSGSSLPRTVDATSVQRLLAGCDRRTGKGRRDFAVLMLLTRLGMRVAEVAALQLGDVDWRRGQILVRGKGNRMERLPLPVDVGEAVAGYARRGPPRTERRELFLRVLAPCCGLTPSAIKVIVHAACDRAGVPPIAAHRLRHTMASDLLRHGAGLPEIGQVLRHRSLASTAIYAKVDTAALRELARPWPGGAA